MKHIVILAVTLFSINSYAMRCGNVLLEKGMNINAVATACGAVAKDDTKTLFITEGNYVHILKFIDGKLNVIDDER